MTDVDFAFHSAFQHRRHHAAQSLLPDAGMSDAKEAEKDDREQSQQDDGAAKSDLQATRHVLERLPDCKAESELVDEAVVYRRLV